MSIAAYVELARPRQWVKNGFVLTGLLFGHALGDPDLVWAAMAARGYGIHFCIAKGS